MLSSSPAAPITHGLVWHTGLLQGLTQAAVVVLCALCGRPGPGPFGFLFMLAAAFIGMGAWVDARRRARKLLFTPPHAIRVDVVRAIAAIVGLVLLRKFPLPFAPLWFFVALLPFWLVVELVLGPSWLLLRLLRISWSRRRWSLVLAHETGGPMKVVESDDGRRFAVDSKELVATGPIYAQLDRDRVPDEPYRSFERIRVVAFEPLIERNTRAHHIRTAALGLVAALGWLLLPLIANICA